MNASTRRWGAVPFIASLWLCCAEQVGAEEKHKKDQPQRIPATGEEDSDIPTSKLPAQPSAPPGAVPQPGRGPRRQAAFPALPGTQLKLAPGEHYRASSLHRMLMGQHYRHAWATPVQVEVLDLRSLGGGLKPEKKGGGKQTLSLTFAGADGRRYKFRTIEKDVTPVLGPELRDSMAKGVLQDQISA